MSIENPDFIVLETQDPYSKQQPRYNQIALRSRHQHQVHRTTTHTMELQITPFDELENPEVVTRVTLLVYHLPHLLPCPQSCSAKS